MAYGQISGAEGVPGEPDPNAIGGPDIPSWTPREPTLRRQDDLAEYWNWVSGWIWDIEQHRERDLATRRAFLSVQGVDIGSEVWDLQLGLINEDYDSQLQEIYQGPTYDILNESYEQYVGSMQQYMDFYKDVESKPARYDTISEQYNQATGGSVADFYTNLFGEYEPASEINVPGTDNNAPDEAAYYNPDLMSSYVDQEEDNRFSLFGS